MPCALFGYDDRRILNALHHGPVTVPTYAAEERLETRTLMQGRDEGVDQLVVNMIPEREYCQRSNLNRHHYPGNIGQGKVLKLPDSKVVTLKVGRQTCQKAVDYKFKVKLKA